MYTYVKLHDLQFSFKKGGDRYTALFVFKTIVDYFNKCRSTVYVSTLDLTKAFNKLN